MTSPIVPSAPQPEPRTGSLPSCGTERKLPNVQRGPDGDVTGEVDVGVVEPSPGNVVAGAIGAPGSVMRVVGVVTPGSGVSSRRVTPLELHAGNAVAMTTRRPYARRRMHPSV